MSATEPPVPSLNDFYAGALAMFAIILFAKFVAHARHDGPPAKGRWVIAHIVCVLTAWFGAITCLIVLGWGDLRLPSVCTGGPSNTECPSLDKDHSTHLVLWLAVISGSILALDVAFTAGTKKQLCSFLPKRIREKICKKKPSEPDGAAGASPPPDPDTGTPD